MPSSQSLVEVAPCPRQMTQDGTALFDISSL